MLHSPHYPCLRVASANSSQGILQRHNYDNFCIASRVSSNTWCFRKNRGDAKHSTVFSSSLHRHLDPSNSLLLLMVPVPAFKNPFIYLCVCLWMFKGIADDDHCTTPNYDNSFGFLSFWHASNKIVLQLLCVWDWHESLIPRLSCRWESFPWCGKAHSTVKNGEEINTEGLSNSKSFMETVNNVLLFYVLP